MLPRIMIRTTVLFIAGLLAAWPALAEAEGPKSLGKFKDWTAFEMTESGGTTCYIASGPKDSKPKDVNRGEIWMLVTHRPWKNVENEVSFYSGYPYKEDSTVRVDIDGTKFDMFTHGETAWAATPSEDQKLVSAMRKGSKMIIRGVSSRGTDTTDMFSLSGFTAAHEAIGKACNVSS